jgi:hypothetical protein
LPAILNLAKRIAVAKLAKLAKMRSSYPKMTQSISRWVYEGGRYDCLGECARFQALGNREAYHCKIAIALTIKLKDGIRNRSAELLEVLSRSREGVKGLAGCTQRTNTRPA